jgi:hypothetical protein
MDEGRKAREGILEFSPSKESRIFEIWNVELRI